MGFLDIFSNNNKKENKKSKQIAKKRLEFVLIQDKIDLSQTDMENLKKDLIQVLNNYIDIDYNQVEMELDKKQEDMMAFIANFPINDVKS